MNNIFTRNFSVFLLSAMLLISVASIGQTNPTAFSLAGGNFSFTAQTASNTTYPTNMQGWTTGTDNIAILPTAAPGADQALVASGSAGTSGLSNLGVNGFNFLSTGSNPNQQVGEIAVALNTTGRSNILVSWTAADQTNGAPRQMNIALQYRIGTTGTFTTVANSIYTTSVAAQLAAQTFSNIALPSAVNNLPVVQIRWVTYETGGQSGGRHAIRLDDITVSSSALSTATMDYQNVQFPNTDQTILETASLTFFTQGYEPGLTESAGPGAGISAWIGYSTTNQNPNTGTWTWVPATFNTQVGNNDEFKATLSGLAPGTYFVASRWQISTGPFTYGGTAGNWASTANNVKVTVNADVVDFANIQSPFTGSILVGNTFNVYAQVYEPGITEAAGQGAGITAWIGTSTTNQNPNTGTWTWVPATFNVQSGNNDEYVANIATGLTAGTYYYASRFLKAGSSTYVYGGIAGIWSSTANNGVLTVNTSPTLAITGTVGHGTTCPATATAPITYTITNTGTIAASGVTVVSNDPQFVVSALSSTTITGNGGTATYVVTFTPASAGAKTATITVASTTTGSNAPTTNLTGTGTTPVTATVTTNAATAVLATTATLNGSVGTLGVCPASTLKGFVYALTAANATPVIGGTGVTATTPATASTGNFNAPLTGLATGSSYSFRAYIYNGTTYTYGAVLTFTTIMPPANDECVNAIALTVDAAAISGNTANASQSLAGCVGNANDDVWYSFTTSVAGTYTITVAGSASFDAVVGVRSGVCPGANLFCVDDFFAGETETVTATGLAANTTYLIRVYDFGTGFPATTTFTIAVTSPPATLSTNGTSALTFANTAVLTPTASQSFNLSGSFLMGAPGNVTVNAPNANFQVSNNNTTWGASTTIAYTTTTLASTLVYVRFVPQSSGAKTGNITFSGAGVSTSPTIALTGTGFLPAPVAIAATNVLATSFNANWSAVAGATGYLLDVSTSATFSVPGGSASVTESFETGLTGSYQTGNVTLSTGIWAVTNVLKGTTGINSGTASAQLQSATGSALISPTFTDVTTVSFYVTSSTSSGAVQVNYSTDGGTTWTPASNSPFTGLGTTKVQKTVTLNIAGDIKLQFVRTAATIYLDDIVINTMVNTPSFVTGFNSLNVGNVTTYNVSGLTPGTTYYYRVRATDGTPSEYSNVITVMPASVGGTAIANQTICANATPADLTLSGNIGNVIRWERASDAAFTTPITIANTTTTLPGATIGALTATTYFRAVVQSGTNPIANSSTVTISVTPAAVAGTITGSGATCAGSTVVLTLTGNVGTIQWQSSLDNVTFTNIQGETGNTYTVTNVTATTYYRVVVSNGGCTPATSASVAVTVGNTTTWNGTSWDNGAPTSTSTAIISGNYSSATNGGNISACTLSVTNNAVVIISTGNDVTLNGILNVATGSNFTLANNANLIQLTDVTNSGSIKVTRNTSPLLRQDYTMWSSPVNGQNLFNFSPLTVVTPTSRFYTYNTSNNFFESIVTPSAVTFATAKGYLIRIRNNQSATTPGIWPGVFTGQPHNGPYTYNMDNFGVVGQTSLRYNLIGNPYPSPIDAIKFVDNNTANITGTLYFWRKTNDADTPTYSSWSKAGYDPNNPQSPRGTFVAAYPTITDPQGIVQTAQGFFVEALGNATEVNFNNSLRINDHANQFFRSNNATVAVPSTYESNRIWLNVTNTAGAFCQTAVGYFTDATLAFDNGIDGKAINDGPIELYTTADEFKLAIQARPVPFDATDVVPMGFKATTAGTYSIGLDHFDGLFSGNQDVFLKDNLTGTQQDLKAGNYSFSTEAGTFADRFEIVYQPALGTNNPVFENTVVIYKQAGRFVINSGSSTMSNVKVFDIRGRLLIDMKNVNASETTFSAGEANQVLVVKITSDANQSVTKKVVN